MRLARRLQLARLLPVGLLMALAFLVGHARPNLPVVEASRSAVQAMAEAADLTDLAQQAAVEHQPVAALAGYRRAYELSADPTLLLEIGRFERELGNPARAAHAFEQFLQVGSPRVSAERLRLTQRRLRDSAASIARLNLQTNVPGARVELEPERGVASTSGFAVRLLLDAGERTLTLSKPGYETRTLVVQVTPGEIRALRVDLDKAAGRSEASPAKPRWARLDSPAAVTFD